MATTAMVGDTDYWGTIVAIGNKDVAAWLTANGGHWANPGSPDHRIAIDLPILAVKGQGSVVAPVGNGWYSVGRAEFPAFAG